MEPCVLIFAHAALRPWWRLRISPSRVWRSLTRSLFAVVVSVVTVLSIANERSISGAVPVGALTTYAQTGQMTFGYTPAQIEAAYNITPLSSQGIDGSGQIIALIELDQFKMSDIRQFDALNQLPNPSIQQQYVGGTPFSLKSHGEATLDVEWAHALAPGAAIRIYYLKNAAIGPNSWKALAAGVDAAVSSGASEISLSFGTCGPSAGSGAAHQAFARALGAGVSVFVSSGDNGEFPGPKRDCVQQPGVSYPASDPSVVSVGGTSLLLNPDNTIAQEVAWSGSGGGRGKPFLRPSWQVTPNLNAGRYRYSPDVAFLGDLHTGVAFVYNGRRQIAGGTSLGAPAWAAVWSLLREQSQRSGATLGAAPELIYRVGNSAAYAGAFHDITSGSNGRYQAAVGWDPVTGWGTPNVSGLESALQALPALLARTAQG